MPRHLSDDWLAALNTAADAHDDLSRRTQGVHLVIEQAVTDLTGSREVARWHVVVNDGAVRFESGAAEAPDIRFTTDADTARAITAGDTTAQTAFTHGRLQVGGDTTVLLAHHDLLDGLGDVFAAVVLDDD